MTMGTDPDITEKNGPKFSIEFPPPIPDKGKAKGQKSPARSQKKKTEKISLPPPVGQKAAPRPIPARGEEQATSQRDPVRSERAKTQKIPEPQSAGPKPAPQPIPVRGEDNATGQNSSGRERGRTVRIFPPPISDENQAPPLPGDESKDSPTPQKPSPNAVFGVLFVLGFVAFAIFIVVQASKGPNPSSVAYSPAGSTVQESDIPVPAQQAETGQENPKPDSSQLSGESAVAPQPSPQINTVSSETSDIQSTPLKQKQTPAPLAIPGLSFDSGQQSNPGNQLSEVAGKSGKDFRWGDYTYKVSHHDWIILSNEKKLYNAQGSYILHLDQKMSDLEKRIDKANWIEKNHLTKLYDSLRNEEQEKVAEHNAEWEKANGMVSSAAIK